MTDPDTGSLLQTAIQHHRAGRLAAAQALYLQLLDRTPNQPDALCYLGVLLHQAGQHDDAANLICQALDLRPDWPEALSNLCLVLQHLGDFQNAIAAGQKALQLQPRLPGAAGNLAHALRRAGQTDQAIIMYQQAILDQPDDPSLHFGLGLVLRESQQIEPSIAALRQAVQLKPTFTAAHLELGHTLRAAGEWPAAREVFHHALALPHTDSGTLYDLGCILSSEGDLDAAIIAYRGALAIQPNLTLALVNLGHALRLHGNSAEAVPVLRQALAFDDTLPEAHLNLASALADLGDTDGALAACRQALALRPNWPDALFNLGGALREQGNLDDALAAYRHAVNLSPAFHVAHSALLCTMHFHPACSPADILAELHAWNRQHAAALLPATANHDNDPSPGRILRIGYVSPDFRDHAVGRNLLPLFKAHDRASVHITAYAHLARPDDMTQKFQRAVDHWRDITTLSDSQLAAQIRDDHIDILVNLALHTPDNRLLTFARKPAPLQVAFAGYPGSTGLAAMDYRLSDPYLDPETADPSMHTEHTLRLPHSFWCFDPLEDADLPVTPLPALTSGLITFGCLNNFSKINPEVIALWSEILRTVPSSCLLLLAPKGAARAWALGHFALHGISPERIIWANRQSRRDYLQLYQRIDIALDPFPYGGHTTSLDGLWMGVPPISLVGAHPVSRAGLSQLSNLQLLEFAATSPAAYVRTACDAARDLPRLAALRASLRPRMQNSPLMDAPGFARGIEAAYRTIWHHWCTAHATAKSHS